LTNIRTRDNRTVIPHSRGLVHHKVNTILRSPVDCKKSDERAYVLALVDDSVFILLRRSGLAPDVKARVTRVFAASVIYNTVQKLPNARDS